MVLVILHKSGAKTAFTSEKLEPSLIQIEQHLEEKTKTGLPEPNSFTFLEQSKIGWPEAYHPDRRNPSVYRLSRNVCNWPL